MHKTRIRHRGLRVSTKDKSSGTTSRATYRLGSVAFPDSETIALQSISIPQMIPNIYTANCDLIYYLSQTINTTAGVNDRLQIQDLESNIIYNIDVGTINGTPATFAADLLTIQNAINAVLPNTIVVLAEDPAPLPNTQPHIQVTVAGGGASIRVLKSSSMALVFGVYTQDSADLVQVQPALMPNPYGGVLVQIPKYQYTIDQLIVVVQDLLNASVAPATVTVEKNSVANPAEPYDKRLIITYTPTTTEVFSIGAEEDGSTVSPTLGYSGETSTSIPLAPALYQLFGPKEIYLHCRQTNQQKSQLSDEGKVVSIHACIPVSVGYGQLLTFTAPHHDFFRVRIHRGSNQLKSFTFTLRDVRGNALSELDPYEYSMLLDMDVIEK